MRETIALHYGLVSYMDDQIGRILGLLERLGLSGNTMIIFYGDNGYMLGNQGLIGKTYMYEESIRVPLIFNWPGKLKPAVVDELVYNMDLLPTVMDIAGVPLPEGLAGKSLLPLLQGKKVELRKAVFCEWYPLLNRMEAVRTKQWKYIRTLEIGEELYNLADDPYELRNLAGKAECRTVLERLKEARRKWERNTGEVRANIGQSEIDGYVRELKANDYDAKWLMSVGHQERILLWMLKLQAEGKVKTDSKLVSMFRELNEAHEARDMVRFQSKAPAFLEELVRCEEESARS